MLRGERQSSSDQVRVDCGVKSGVSFVIDERLLQVRGSSLRAAAAPSARIHRFGASSFLRALSCECFVVYDRPNRYVQRPAP